MHAAEAFGADHALTDFGDGQTGGIGSQNAIGACQLRNFFPELLLDLQVFQNRLYHHIAGGKAGFIQCKTQAGLDLGRFFGSQVTGLDLADLIHLNQLAAALQSGFGNIVQNDIAAVFCEKSGP